MILEGLKLMIIGMIIVYIFLIVLMLFVILSAKLFKGSGVVSAPAVVKRATDDADIIAVVSAAISRYRSNKSKRK